MTNTTVSSPDGDAAPELKTGQQTLTKALPIYNQLIAALKPADRSLLENVHPDFFSFVKASEQDAETFYGVPPEMPLSDASDLIKIKHNIVSHIVNQLYWPGMFALRLDDFKKLADADVDKIKYELIKQRYESLSDSKKKLLEKVYDKSLGKCRRRVFNVVKSAAPNFKDLLPFIFGDSNITDIRSVGTEMGTEFEHFCEDFKSECRRAEAMTDEETEAELLSFSYSFLSDDDLMPVREYYISHGFMPMFFLFEKAMLSPEADRNEAIFRAYFGIGSEKMVSKKELSIQFGLAQERIRQIIAGVINSDKPFPTLLSDAEGWSRYAFLNSDIISRETSEFDKLKEDEHLESSFYAFLGLCLLLKPDMILLPKRENTKSVTLENIFLIDRDLSMKFDFDKALAYCQNNSALNKQHPMRENLSAIAGRFILSGDVDDEILKVLKYIITRDKDITIEGDDVVYSQNKVNKDAVLYDILLSEGKPMHKEEMFRKFKEMFPDEKCKNSSCMTRIFADDKRIKNIGRTGFYTLAEWSYYSGTGVELIVRILSESRVPLRAAEIIKHFKKYNPIPDKSVIYGHLSYALHNKHVKCMANGLYYLPSKHYDKKGLSKKDDKKSAVDDMLNEYKTFVTRYRHLPVSSGDDTERHLYKWYNNVMNKHVNLTKMQQKKFESFNNRLRKLPQNAKELAFKYSCEEYKAFLSVYGRVPSGSFGEPGLAKWFSYAHRLTKSLSADDNRKVYFSEVEKTVEKVKNKK